MIIARNDFVSIDYDDCENRIIFLDSDNEFINDWYLDGTDKNGWIETAKSFLANTDIETAENIGKTLDYVYSVYVSPTSTIMKEIFEHYGIECVNRIGNVYLTIEF